jgi:pimeloyl-ACP methyl ester carboxylesterase
MDPAVPHLLDRLAGMFLGSGQLFSDGWGDAGRLEKVLGSFINREAAPMVVHWRSPPVQTDGVWERTGCFETPVAAHLLPPESQTGVIRVLQPEEDPGRAPVCIMLASTGEVGFARRRKIILPLVRQGTAAVILENPYYGVRRPCAQVGTALRSFADQVTMNGATVEEARSLSRWFYERGHTRVALWGYSMGGYMAALAGSHVPFPVAVVPCAAGYDAAQVLTRGVLSQAIAWKSLAGQGSESDARARMAQILSGVCSTLRIPQWPSAAILVAARRDGYVDPHEVERLHRHWPGSELRWIEGGHVTAFLSAHGCFRQAVADALSRLP